MSFVRSLLVHRRADLTRVLAMALAGAVLALPLALTGVTTASAQQKVSEMALMSKQPLPDIVQGKADAPVTMIEYASMTCGHCAHFHETVYPTLLKNYIETGKVKFILREFPLDPLATAGFMLARCAGPEKRTAVVDLLFDKQQNWAFVEKPLQALQDLLKQTGMSSESFEACLKDQKLYDNVNEVRDGGSTFGVSATPTFYVNGTKVTGEVTPESLAKILDPLVNKKS